MTAPIRLTPDEHYNAAGNLTDAGRAEFASDNLRLLAALFTPGDVVLDDTAPKLLGIVIEVGVLSVRVAWQDGGCSDGPGFLPMLRHREPRINVPVPFGLLAPLVWSLVRRNLVRDALCKAGAL